MSQVLCGINFESVLANPNLIWNLLNYPKDLKKKVPTVHKIGGESLHVDGKVGKTWLGVCYSFLFIFLEENGSMDQNNINKLFL